MPDLVTRDSILALLAVARFGACATSPDGTIVSWNHRAEQILGLPAAQVIGRRFEEIVEETAPHQAFTGPAPSPRPLRHLSTGLARQPLVASISCASGKHKQVALTPVVIADRAAGDTLTLYLFDDPPQPPLLAGADQHPTDSPAAQNLGSAAAPAADQTIRPHPAIVSRREAEILRLVAGGVTTDQIAIDLGISIHTVRNHIRSLRRKLNAKTKLDAVVIALQNGVI